MGEVPTFGTPTEGCPYVVRPSAYALVRNAAGQLAVIQTPRGCFLPGGGLEADEAPQQTIEREAREEGGLILAAGQVLGEAIDIVYAAAEDTCFEKRCVFIASDVAGHTVPTELDHALLWLTPDRAVAALSLESHRWAVQSLHS
jgi:8-oxo-dGTP diphosphatase